MVVVHMRMLSVALELSTAAPVIILSVMWKKGSASRYGNFTITLGFFDSNICPDFNKLRH